MLEPDLCRGWTESKIVDAVEPASELQRKILRSIADNWGTTQKQIAHDVGAGNWQAVSGALSSWYRHRTRPLGVKDPADGRDSWPMMCRRRGGSPKGEWQYFMPPEVADIVRGIT